MLPFALPSAASAVGSSVMGAGGGLSGLFSSVGNVMGPIGAVGKVFGRKKKKLSAEQVEAMRLMDKAGDIAEDLMDPNSTRFKTTAEQEYRRGQVEIQDAIRSMQLAEQRARARGLSGAFFNPERRDEMASNIIARGAVDNAFTSQDRARDILTQQMQALRAAAGDANAMGAMTAGVQGANQQMKSDRLSAIFDIGKYMAGPSVGGQGGFNRLFGY